MFAHENFLGIKTMRRSPNSNASCSSSSRPPASSSRGSARAVEAAGRRAGGSDGVSAVLNDSGRGDLSENDWNCKRAARRSSRQEVVLPLRHARDPDERRIDPDGARTRFPICRREEALTSGRRRHRCSRPKTCRRRSCP